MMKVLISGHRTEKLKQYDLFGLEIILAERLATLYRYNYITGLSGMANGIDLMFCRLCITSNIQYYACPPFEEQDEYMNDEEKELISKAIGPMTKLVNYD